MRKTVLILLGVVLYLLLGAGGAIPADAVPRRIETVSGCSPELNRTIDRFACERICNSDLQLPAPARIVQKLLQIIVFPDAALLRQIVE